MTDAQREALQRLCGRYNVEFNEGDYVPAFDLPDGWVSGWVGGVEHADKGQKVDPDKVIFNARMAVDAWFNSERNMSFHSWMLNLRNVLDARKGVTIFVGCDPDGGISS